MNCRSIQAETNITHVTIVVLEALTNSLKPLLEIDPHFTLGFVMNLGDIALNSPDHDLRVSPPCDKVLTRFVYFKYFASKTLKRIRCSGRLR
jgi:hypothetical protein